MDLQDYTTTRGPNLAPKNIIAPQARLYRRTTPELELLFETGEPAVTVGLHIRDMPPRLNRRKCILVDFDARHGLSEINRASVFARGPAVSLGNIRYLQKAECDLSSYVHGGAPGVIHIL